MKLGILGGGQLGLMMMPHLQRLGIISVILDGESAVAKVLSQEHRLGDFKNDDDVQKLDDCDVVTVEIEHVNIKGLEKLLEKGVQVHPSPAVLQLIQDKFLQKSFFIERGIPTSTFEKRILEANEVLGNAVVVKQCRGGYDGKGVWVPAEKEVVPESFQTEVLIEEKITLDCEIAVLVARGITGEVKTYPAVEMVFDSTLNLIDSTFCPARITKKISDQALSLAAKIVEELDYVGLMAVEMFVDKNQKILVNELAPRPHNSGHFSIEGCYVDQFEQHIRAVCSLPLGSSELREEAMTINLIGEEGYVGETLVEGLEELSRLEKVYLHLYGKKDCRPGRKMGHITILGAFEHCQKLKEEVKKCLKVKGSQKL
jgi:5-(carboxyamino)imidazole ribonucleotide synthase